jgi:hypothetical protein
MTLRAILGTLPVVAGYGELVDDGLTGLHRTPIAGSLIESIHGQL